MVGVYVVPPWFFGYDILFEVIFAVVASLVSLYAFKVYKLSGQKPTQVFGTAFLLIAFSYLVQAFMNLLIITKLNSSLCVLMKIHDVTVLNYLGISLHLFFFMLGIFLLSITSLRIEDIKVQAMLLLIILASLVLTDEVFLIFYSISSIMLLFIVIHHVENYLQHRHRNPLLVLIGFALLLCSSITFLLSGRIGIYYFIGHIFELAAYVMLLISLMLMRSKKR